ncbi:MAG TPA: neuraminidase-like domain-containing protein, partial [Verrucomicrobiae bacterium]|nr:neuraminidase-like domain-containing protein [Verrucomicrobiae bacterium]
MAVINTGPLPIQSLNQQILEALKDPVTSQVVSAQLNTVLQTALIASANSRGGLPALVSVLENLRPADLAADQNLSLRDYVTKYAALPTDPAQNKAAQQAIATLSTSTTVGQLLGLNQTIAANPIFGGFVAQTNLVSLMATSPSLAAAALQTDFIQKYTSYQGSTQGFWNQISQDATLKAAIPELQFTMQLGVLTLNNAALVSALRASYKPNSIRDLTKVNVSTLTQLITTQKISVPPSISGSTPTEQIANYASGIVTLLQLAFPTDYMAQTLSSSKDTTLQSVAKVLGNAPDIDLQTTNLSTYLKQNSATAFQGIPPAQISAVTARLQAAQRVFRINQQPSVAQALLEAGMDSAAKITAMASSVFVSRFSAALGGGPAAQAVYTAASHINAQTLNLYGTIQSGLTDVSPRVIADPNLTTAQAIQQQIPNWQTLFGPTSYCACGECTSVYGPAAYFVDLLQFLRSSGLNSAGNSPLDILIGNAIANPPVPGRRPDLQYIKLNCRNANTPLPYVDLVNEILESYVVLGGSLGQSSAHNTQSDATASELRVNPEYVLQAAYDQVAAATYPPSLPYNRFIDIARTYLTFLGGDRRQVIENFGTQASPFDGVGTLAAETLGLSPAEFTIIANWDLSTGSATTPPLLTSLYVGNTPATTPWETWIATASVFIQQTGLTFDDLIHLLEAEFINPGQTISLSGTGVTACDIENTVITPLDDAALTRIYPFLRLWKKLGWSMSDLDKFLRVFGTNGINRGCLLALADFVWLQGRLNLTVPQLLALWSTIDADGRNSLYLTLFQNKAVLNPVDQALRLSYRAGLAAMPATLLPPSVSGQLTYDSAHLQLVFPGTMSDEQRDDLLTWASGNPAAILAVENLYEMRWFNGTDIAQPSGTITAETPAILAALRISTDDLNAIRTATGLTDSATQTPLTLNNLSQLYRYTLLSQAIGFPIADLIALISLTGINPFQLATSDPVTAPAVQFVRAAQAVLASPFAVADLDYVYRAEVNPAAGVGPLDTTVDLLAITLQTGLGKITAANSYTPDPTGKVLRQKLGTITAGSELDDAMGLISGTAVYKVALAALPAGLDFPTALAQIVSYDVIAHELEFSGAMTDAQETTLLNLPGADSAYKAAIAQLYQQPREIISSDLAFLDPTAALTNLITTPLPTAADRYAFVLQALLNYLTATQSRSFLQQTLAQTFGLSSAMVALLVIGDSSLSSAALLKSQRDSTQPAIVDLLDLQQGGLLETLYSDIALTTVAGTQVETSVDIAGIPNPGGATWQGKVQAEFSEAYTFYVTANDGVRLWVDDQLLFEQWASHGSANYTSAPINLNAGQLYDFRLDHFNNSGNAPITLGWSSKSTNNNASTPIPVTALFPQNAFLTLDRLYPIALLLTKFAVKPDELAYLSSNGAAFQGVDPGNTANTINFDLTALPLDRSNASAVDHLAPAFFNQWSRLNDLFQLRNSLPSGNTTLFDIFRTASASTSPTTLGTATTGAVLAATGWDPLQFSTLAGRTTNGAATVGFGLSDADFVNEKGTQGRGLVWLQKCLSLRQRLGVPVLQLFLWANQAPDAQQSDDIKSTVKAKYDDATWTTVGQPLNDKIRDHSKSALIAYVLNMPAIVQLGFTSADDLYTYFLIDVQMSPCMLTSRIVQATAAVQLFVQRCLLNLESNNTNAALNVSPGAIDASQWEWRKNYRVWEANREVFLYPENWIDPTLRDNRTPFFQDLQTDLQQGPVT